MSVRVDRTKCSGIGMCEMTAPSVFEVGADGQAVVIDENPPESERAQLAEAIANCPTVALSLRD
jgi:ferredoxin